MTSGFVSLVGAGPGDPELLTLKGLRRLRQADVVLYDALANPALLAECRPDALLIHAGKRAGLPHLTQPAISALLIEQARLGRQVVRLKGGDPFVFGRGGEEALALAAAGIAWEVVPGVSSAIGVPAYAGIPVTHRGVAASVAFVTGHESAEQGAPRPDWGALAQGVDTLVVLMGLGKLGEIASKLIGHGRAGDTPAAVIGSGTTADQETVVGTLATIGEEVERAGLAAPATLVVGEVVRLRQRLSWFDTIETTEALSAPNVPVYVVRESY